MNHTDLKTLLNRGRRAGLTTAEIYSTLSARRPSAREVANGGTDGNGFVASYDRDGRRVYGPLKRAG